MSPVAPGTFAAIFAVLYVAHQVADHWVQTSPQACGKKQPGWSGRLACGRHVATYTATLTVFLLAATWVFGLSLNLPATASGMAVTAVTHYLLDRSQNLARLAKAVGLAGFFRLGLPRPGHDDNPGLGTGAYALDQSAHLVFLAVTAAIIAGGAA